MILNKQDEITLMQTSHLKPLTTHIKGMNRSVQWNNCWDYKSGLHDVTFKTLTPPPVKHALLSSRELDFRPILNKTMYVITIKRF
jgi:hypothetical protein